MVRFATRRCGQAAATNGLSKHERKTPSQAVAAPPKPEEVPALLEKLVADWKENFEVATVKQPLERVREIAAFHAGFLRIHPFLDGNGRVLQRALCITK
ncbi:MAG: Fic family protein [Deltaproteobacteria bacterium]|nr:Fic family protein [Deltaproteobacteria bacterium]